MSTKTPTESHRLQPLDAMRGVAALGVAFFHYQHFGGDPKRYPWIDTEPATWLYARGWMLVDFFFLLSGIVFTYKYLETLSERKLPARQFFFLRMSRIYPLHVASLLVCAAVQWPLMVAKQPAIIYLHNDLYHFVLNLFFLQNGAFEEGYSYNGSSWSVATEVFAYVVFFGVTWRWGKQYLVGATVVLLVALGVYKAQLNYPFANETMARAVIGFFVGSLLFLAMHHAQKAGVVQKLAIFALVVLVAIAWMGHKAGYDAFVGGTGYRTAIPHVLGVFPLVIIAGLHVRPLAWVLSLRPLTYLGDISYSVYMLHVPVQMIMIRYMRAHGIEAPTEKPAFFLGFLVTLIVLAMLTHRFFEVPARGWLRRKLLPRESV